MELTSDCTPPKIGQVSVTGPFSLPSFVAQSAADAAAAVEPAGHGEQLAEPASEAVPGGHCVQAAAPAGA